MTNDDLLKLVPGISNLGVGLIFVYLFLRKDSELKALYERVVDAFAKNAVASEGVKSATEANKVAIEANTKVTEKLGDRIEEFLRDGRKSV